MALQLSDHDRSEVDFVLSCVQFVQGLSSEQRKELIAHAELCEYESGTFCLTEEAETRPAFYIVLNGQALLHRTGERKVVFFPGNRFGQELLELGKEQDVVMSPYSVQAKTDLRCARIALGAFRQIYNVDHVDMGVAVDKVVRRKERPTTAPQGATEAATKEINKPIKSEASSSPPSSCLSSLHQKAKQEQQQQMEKENEASTVAAAPTDSPKAKKRTVTKLAHTAPSGVGVDTGKSTKEKKVKSKSSKKKTKTYQEEDVGVVAEEKSSTKGGSSTRHKARRRNSVDSCTSSKSVSSQAKMKRRNSLEVASKSFSKSVEEKMKNKSIDELDVLASSEIGTHNEMNALVAIAEKERPLTSGAGSSRNTQVTSPESSRWPRKKQIITTRQDSSWVRTQSVADKKRSDKTSGKLGSVSQTAIDSRLEDSINGEGDPDGVFGARTNTQREIRKLGNDSFNFLKSSPDSPPRRTKVVPRVLDGSFSNHDHHPATESPSSQVKKLGEESFSFLTAPPESPGRPTAVFKRSKGDTSDLEFQAERDGQVDPMSDSFNQSESSLQGSKSRFEQSLSLFENENTENPLEFSAKSFGSIGKSEHDKGKRIRKQKEIMLKQTSSYSQKSNGGATVIPPKVGGKIQITKMRPRKQSCDQWHNSDNSLVGESATESSLHGSTQSLEVTKVATEGNADGKKREMRETDKYQEISPVGETLKSRIDQCHSSSDNVGGGKDLKQKVTPTKDTFHDSAPSLGIVGQDKPKDRKTGQEAKVSPVPQKRTGEKIGKLQNVFEGRKTNQTNPSSHSTRCRPPSNVCQKPLEVKEGYKPPHYKKTEKEERQITRALSKCFAFKAMPKRNLKALIAAFEPQQANAGTEIVGPEKVDDTFFVVADGEVSVDVDGKQTDFVGSGETFGESNLFHPPRLRRKMSIVATRKTSLFKVDQTTYRSILQVETTKVEKRKRELLDRLPFLANTPQETKVKMVNLMKRATFETGEPIPLDEAEGGKRFYIVDEGTARCRDYRASDDLGRAVFAGESFGEEAFIKPKGLDRAVTAVAETDVSAFYIEMSSLEEAVGPVSRVIVPNGVDLKELDAVVATFKGLRFDEKKALTLEEQKAVLALFKNKVYEKGDVIIEANREVPASFYYLRYGMAESHGTSVCFIMSGNILGKELFLSAKASNSTIAKDSKRTIAADKCVVGVIEVSEYLLTRDAYLKRGNHTGYRAEEAHDESDSDIDSDSDTESESDTQEVGVKEPATHKAAFENLVKKSILGEGGFGQVWLVFDKTETEKKGYALKIQSKYELTMAGDAEVAVREKNIMAALHHPNIIKLLASYQDKHFLYLLMDLVQGGELYSLLHPNEEEDQLVSSTGLSEAKARFYAFAIADAIAHVHERGFVYRDLKPENVLIDRYGFPVLVDFGLAKYLPKGEKTFTLRGTPGYLPPECILNTGHTFSADHWALGILIYEMICGESPFFYLGIDQVELYRQITEDPHGRPESASETASKLIDGLLRKDPAMRLGSLSEGERDVWCHRWFEGMDVIAMRQRKLKAPWIPDIKDPFDTSNFEEWLDLEDKCAATFPSLSPKETLVFERF